MESHLLQMRGLKLLSGRSDCDHLMSHLLQMRGLKHYKRTGYEICKCRIFYRCVD